MDTICAPAYANISMAQFDAKRIYLYIHGKALLFLRYVDNIFMIWNGTTDERTNKQTYMPNRIIPNLLKAAFHTAKRYA